jgi:perosamine synthetase
MRDEALALNGGTPVRSTLLPYGRQSVDEEDVAAVTAVLRSDWLTTGPNVAEFERAFAAFVGAKEAVAVSSGTAALHTAYEACGIGPGDEVIMPAMTFAATANMVVALGAVPVFADSDEATLLVDPRSAEACVTPRTKAIVGVDYGGHPCFYDEMQAVADRHGLAFIADACHALGALSRGRRVGSIAPLNTFSFHPVKPLTTGEGGMITTDNPAFATRMRQFRNHCLTSDHRERHEQGSFFYEQTRLGFNYRLTDLQCALGLSQLRRVPAWTARRQAIAATYDAALREIPAIEPPVVREGVTHAYHLYVIRLRQGHLTVGRDEFFKALRAENIGVNVHYIPVHYHPFYRERFGARPGLCPVAEAAYERMVTLPLFSAMTDQDAADVIAAVRKVCRAYRC